MTINFKELYAARDAAELLVLKTQQNHTEAVAVLQRREYDLAAAKQKEAAQ